MMMMMTQISCSVTSRMQIKLCGDTGDAATTSKNLLRSQSGLTQSFQGRAGDTSFVGIKCIDRALATLEQPIHVTSLFPVTHRHHRLAERERRLVNLLSSTIIAASQLAERERRAVLSTTCHRKRSSDHAVNDDI